MELYKTGKLNLSRVNQYSKNIMRKIEAFKHIVLSSAWVKMSVLNIEKADVSFHFTKCLNRKKIHWC